MKWERFGSALVFILASALAAWPALAAEKERSFRIESKNEKSGPRPGTLEVTYTLVNSSSKRITAWDFGCADILHDGTDGGLTRTSVDAYRTLEMRLEGRYEGPLSGEGIVEPNQRLEKVIVFDSAELSGPYAATTCGPIVAIFEDATFEGSPKLADAHFEHRAKEAVDARRVHLELEKRIREGKALAESIEALSASPTGRSLSGFRQVLRRGDSLSSELVFEQLGKDYAWAVRHLSADWRAWVEKELQ